MSNLKINVAFAIEDLIANQQKAVAFMSDAKQAENLKNQINRLKRAKAFNDASDIALTFIVQNSNVDTFEALVRSDDKSSCSSYKSAQRINDLAHLLSNQSCVESIKRAYNNFLALRKQYDTMNKTQFCNKLSSTSAYADNVLKALYFFNLIDTTASKRSNERFIDRMSANDTITIK